MSHDVTQWIAEIKTMREQVAEAQRDRDTALETASKWNQLYNTEAEQRRAEAKLSHDMIEALKVEIQQLKADITVKSDEAADISAISQEVEELETFEQLKQKLLEVMLERVRLMKALKAEQANHAHTRQALTTALSDTVDLLTKQRNGSSAEVKPASETEAKPVKLPEPAKQPAVLPIEPKNPSLQLPPTRPAPPRL